MFLSDRAHSGHVPAAAQRVLQILPAPARASPPTPKPRAFAFSRPGGTGSFTHEENFLRAEFRPGKAHRHFTTAPARSAGRACGPRTRYPDALPEPSIIGTGPGSDRPRCRRSTPDLRSRYPLPILTPLLRKSEHPARGTRRAPGAKKAPDAFFLHPIPRQNETHAPELSRVATCSTLPP